MPDRIYTPGLPVEPDASSDIHGPGFLPVPSSAGGSLGSGNLAAMLALNPGVAGGYFIRTDTAPNSVWYLLNAAAPSAITSWLKGSAIAAPIVQQPFVGAGSLILWYGRGTLLQLEITSSAGGGTVLVEDALTTGNGTSFGSNVITAGTTPVISYNSGLGRDVYLALLLTVTGTINGFAVMRSRS